LPKKKAKTDEVVLEHIARVIEEMKEIANNIDMEIDNIKRFANEVVSIFATDSRYIKDQLLLMAQRIAELERMAYEFSPKKEEEQQQ